MTLGSLAETELCSYFNNTIVSQQARINLIGISKITSKRNNKQRPHQAIWSGACNKMP
jgi:hypothetical protein